MTKIAISLPDALFRQIERARKRSKKDRSAWLQEAASEHLKRRSKEELMAMYFEGYRRIPDRDDPDFIELEQVGRADMPADDDDEWERLYRDTHRAR